MLESRDIRESASVLVRDGEVRRAAVEGADVQKIRRLLALADVPIDLIDLFVDPVRKVRKTEFYESLDPDMRFAIASAEKVEIEGEI